MGFYRAIYNNIAASTSDFFFRPRPAASDEKKNPRFRGYIVVYSPPKPHIYITYIYIYIYIMYYRLEKFLCDQYKIHLEEHQPR